MKLTCCFGLMLHPLILHVFSSRSPGRSKVSQLSARVCFIQLSWASNVFVCNHLVRQLMNWRWKTMNADKLCRIWQLPERRVHRPTPFLQTKIVNISEEPSLGSTSIRPSLGRFLLGNLHKVWSHKFDSKDYHGWKLMFTLPASVGVKQFTRLL